ncbi:hypothetical protein [Streptomyces buecherae]|uniref:hypothetical protein n=1 Tax=Streptomyces buecherae TaxID=2763006 RepID=UPI001C26CC3C|nr:hypothetical protein [Streptomyces buecherae]
MGERETWTTEEFGASHEGAVGVLLSDGTVPPPVAFDMCSGGGGQSVAQWSIYDGRNTRGPRAAALRAVCSCSWTGPKHALDWDEIGEQELAEAGAGTADACMQDWDVHTAEVEKSAVALPETATALLAQLEEEIEKLAKTSPLAVLRVARRLEVTAAHLAYWSAHDARQGTTAEQAAAALGLNEDAARMLLARFGRLSSYR